MAALSTDLFISGVIGLMRMSDAARETYKLWRQQHDIGVLPDQIEPASDVFCDAWALTHLRDSVEPEIVHMRETDFSDLFEKPDSQISLTIRPGAEAKKVEAVRRVRETLLGDCTCIVDGHPCRLDDVLEIPIGQAGEAPARIPRMLVIQHERWEQQPQALWAPFARALVRTTTDIAVAYPAALGLGPKAEKIIMAMAPTIDTVLSMDSGAGGADAASNLVDAFLAGALEVAAAHPDLITSDRDLKPLIEGILTPLAEEAGREGGLRRLPARRMRDFFTGPLAHGILQAISENSDLYLKGEFAADELAGAVARAALADFVSVERKDFSLRDVMSEKSGLVLYNKLLATVADQPALVIRSSGEVSDALRDFLSGAALRLADAPAPYNWQSDLGADILASAFDVGGKVAAIKVARRLDRELDGSDWTGASKDFATHLIDGFVVGLKGAYVGGDGQGGPRFANVIEAMFTRQQAVDLFKIAANAVASDPSIVLPAHANTQMTALTQTMAAAIASDESGLLSSEDWRTVLSLGLAQAAKNPSTLFAMDGRDPEQQILSVLLSTLLAKASANMSGDATRPGRIMFGETLREALIATLDAATKSVRGAVRPAADQPSALEEFLLNLDGFLAEQGGGGQVRMNADDWLRVFKHFIVQVLDTPPDAPVRDRVSMGDISNLLKDIQPVVVTAAPAAAQPVVLPVPAPSGPDIVPPPIMEEVG